MPDVSSVIITHLSLPCSSIKITHFKSKAVEEPKPIDMNLKWATCWHIFEVANSETTWWLMYCWSIWYLFAGPSFAWSHLEACKPNMHSCFFQLHQLVFMLSALKPYWLDAKILRVYFLYADTCTFNNSICQPLVLGPRGRAQKTREMAEGAGAPPAGAYSNLVLYLHPPSIWLW